MNKFTIIDEENEEFFVENHTHCEALMDFFYEEGMEWWNDIQDDCNKAFKVIDEKGVMRKFIVEREFEPKYYIWEKS